MADDVQILPFEVHDAPNEWLIPDALKIMPKAITAVFDGSAAAGDFLPTLEIISDSGHLVARIPTDTAVVAGDSAEVTFAPFLRGATGSTPSGAVVAPWASIRKFYGAVTPLQVAPGSGATTIDWTGGKLRVSDVAIFGWNNGNPTFLEIANDNLTYAVTVLALVTLDGAGEGVPGTFNNAALEVQVGMNSGDLTDLGAGSDFLSWGTAVRQEWNFGTGTATLTYTGQYLCGVTQGANVLTVLVGNRLATNTNARVYSIELRIWMTLASAAHTDTSPLA